MEQFYKWYEISYQFIRHQSSQELRHSLRTQRTNYLQNYVTPSLFYWHKHPNIEAPYNKNYCSPGADTFTCLQDFDLKWLENSDVKLKTTSGNIAQIQYVVNKEYELTVYLIVSQGSWKIYKIKSKF